MIQKKYFFIFFIFSNFVFSESLFVKSENKELSLNIEKHFKDKKISASALKEFLLKNSYYSSEITKKNGKTFIKSPYKIIFIFKGNTFLKEQDLRKLVKLDENKIGSFFYNFVEKPIKQAYQEKGFLKVKITKTERKEAWKKWIVLNISEGSRVRIGELKVKGLLSKPSSYYEKIIIDNSTELIKSGTYNKKDLEKGYKGLINYLKSEGYLQSKIYSDRVFFKDNTAFIVIQLEEGPLIFIRDIQIKNTKSIPVWEILSHIESRIQSTLKVDKVQQDIGRIEDLYKSRGYIQAEVTNKDNIIKYNPARKYADLVIEIDEGPKAFISKVTFLGLRKVRPDLINSLLKFKVGDTLTPLKKEKSLQALSSTGLFSNISFNESAKGNEMEVTALFKERKTKTLRGGLGLNTQRGLTTQAWTELTHRNLFGWGRALVARASSQINLTQGPFFEYEFSGRYKEVFIPKYAYQGNVNLSHSKNLFRYLEDNINFVQKTQLSFFIDKNINKSLSLKWNVLSFENRKEFCTSYKCPENPQQIGSTNIKLLLDERNNIFDPSEGYLLSWMTEWATPILGSDKKIAFIKTDINSYFYWSFLKNYTVGLVLKGGVISTIQNSQYLPVSRAFILGGYSSLRGYDGNIEGERLPRKKHSPIETANEALKLKRGGLEKNVTNSQYVLMKVNFSFPVFKGFKGLLFYDLGAVYLKNSSQKLLDYGHSAGLGFRYQTFLIPIGLDIAYQLSPKECIQSNGGECSFSRFHLSIGW